MVKIPALGGKMKTLLVSLLAAVSFNAFAGEVLWEEKAGGQRLVARDTTYLACLAVNNTRARGVERLCVRGGLMDGITPEKFAQDNGYTKIDRVGLLAEGGVFYWVIVVIK